MRTKDRLAHALREAGIEDMARRARAGYYDDFISELDTPILQLCEDLADLGTRSAMELRDRVKAGEFDTLRDEY
jgi:hypothetical protein